MKIHTSCESRLPGLGAFTSFFVLFWRIIPLIICLLFLKKERKLAIFSPGPESLSGNTNNYRMVFILKKAVGDAQSRSP